MEIKSQKEISKTYILPVYKENESIKFFEESSFSSHINTLLEDFPFEGKTQQTKEFYLDNQQHIVLIGLSKEPSFEEMRKAGNTIYNFSKNYNQVSIALSFEEQLQKSFLEGLMLSDYSFSKYCANKEEDKSSLNFGVIGVNQEIIEDVENLCEVVKEVRDLVNENADITTPQYLEDVAKKFAKKYKLQSTILDEKQIQKQGLNLIHAVGKGSDKPPRLIIVEYNGNPNSKEKTALVGKGITFDTGGTNLKPSGHVEDMKLDMAGAATAYGAFKYLVEQKVEENLLLVMPCAENALSHNAYKPGDVFIGYSGRSVEVMNTDAEGRLVLADALSYAQNHFQPTKIIDMATLTGASLVALGPSIIATLGNSQDALTQIFESGETTGERVWQFPIYDEHREMLKSPIADCKNIGGKLGGTITAAAFLEQFIEDGVEWTHLDMAGPAWFDSQKSYVPRYATGIGVRLLVDYIKNKK